MSGFFEPDAAQAYDPSAIVRGCIESGTRAVLLNDRSTPPAFFDLSTRMAGEVLHGLGRYQIRLAVVVPDVTEYSSAFQDFAREANRGGRYRFFTTRKEAVAWLDAG